MAAKDRLTAKQEAFAFAVGYENKSYSQAYREIYTVKPETLDKTVWKRASELANNGEVSGRIDELREQKRKEVQRTLSWTLKESENELRDIIKKNKNDLIRAERQGQSAKHANNSAILGAIQQLTDLVKLTLPVKAASDSGNNQDDELKRLADSLEKLK
nr:MAG TPA: Terminase small subunit [Caudoviricetes sp.]